MKFNIHAILTVLFFIIGIILLASGIIFDYNMNLLLMGCISILFAETHYDSYIMNKLENRIKVLERIYD